MTDADDIGRAFCEALGEAGAAGLGVHTSQGYRTTIRITGLS